MTAQANNVFYLTKKDYKSHTLNSQLNLKRGYEELVVRGSEIDSFKNDLFLKYGSGHKTPTHNSCFRLTDSGGTKHALAIYKKEKGGFEFVDEKAEHANNGNIQPRNEEQYLGYTLASDPRVELLTFTGEAGTGKTLIATSAGYPLLMAGVYKRIVVIRPTVEAGQPQGSLPGDEDQKHAPWKRPIITNLKLIGANYDALLKKDMIDIIPVNYLAGETFLDTYIIIDEAQNFVLEDLKLALTRAGYGSKIVIAGDLSQIARNAHMNVDSSGLSKMVDAFKGVDIYAHLNMVLSERSYLAHLASKLM